MKSFIESLQAWFKKKVSINDRDTFPKKVKRGDIYWVDFGINIGSEFNFKRPGVIISVNRENRRDENVCIIPITTWREHKRYFELDVILEEREVETLKKSVIKTKQLRDVSKKRLGIFIGKLPESKMAILEAKLCVFLGIKKEE